ncbi:MAG: PorP/SprF family type IX secretion system membrane protein [Bacteroidales bacterium]|nr:PorP/SprF family type IX secretion system membrane protein [Bacteroidales bacterium]
MTIILVIFSIFQFFLTYSQDIHFSQFFMSPMNLNPAESGTYYYDYRFHLNYRSQWYSVTIPYTTYSFSFENNLKLFPLAGRAGYGFLFNNDYAGDGKFGTLQCALNIYYSSFVMDSSFFFAVGFLPLFNQNTIDFSKFYFDNQYNGITYDPNIPHNEMFPEKKFYFFDFNGGIYISKKINNSYLNFGIGLFHIFKPQKSFYNSYKVLLDRKFNIYTNLNMPITENVIFSPMLLWSNQYKLKEIYIGGLFTIESANVNFNKYYLGLSVRANDAIILYGGFNYNNTQLVLSYDINISPLMQASHMRGGIEIGIRHLFYKSKKVFVIDKHICPTIL